MTRRKVVAGPNPNWNHMLELWTHTKARRNDVSSLFQILARSQGPFQTEYDIDLFRPVGPAMPMRYAGLKPLTRHVCPSVHYAKHNRNQTRLVDLLGYCGKLIVIAFHTES